VVATDDAGSHFSRQGAEAPLAVWWQDRPLSIVVQSGTEPLVTVSGELDIATAGGLRDCLLRVICRYGPRLALDLEGVTFMDCAGINALVATRRRARLEGGWVHIIRASPCAGRLLTLLRIGRLFAAKEQSVAGTLFEIKYGAKRDVDLHEFLRGQAASEVAKAPRVDGGGLLDQYPDVLAEKFDGGMDHGSEGLSRRRGHKPR
jgi:anti-anti-sigma factor